MVGWVLRAVMPGKHTVDLSRNAVDGVCPEVVYPCQLVQSGFSPSRVGVLSIVVKDMVYRASFCDTKRTPLK